MTESIQHLFFSAHDWNDLWRAQQPFCQALGQRGEEVIYVPFLTSLFKAIQPRHAEERKKVWLWLRGQRRGAHSRSKNVREYFVSPMWHLGSSFPQTVTAQVRAVGRIVKRHISVNRRRVIWGDHPFAYALRDIYPKDILVGYIIDDIGSFPGVNTLAMEKAERKLAKKADLVIVVTRALEARFRSYGANVLLCYNGAPAEVDKWVVGADLTPIHPTLRDLPRPLIGYVGSLCHYLDLDLLRAVVETFTTCTLALVGPNLLNPAEARWKWLREHPRVVIRPAVPYNELASCVAPLDVCLLPYVKNDLMRGADPGKMNLYFALGKPVAAVRINSDIDRYAKLAYLADRHDDFLLAVGAAIEEGSDIERQTARRNHVLGWTWKDVARTVRERIYQDFGV